MDINELIEKYSLPSSPPEAHYTVYKLTDPAGKIYIGCTGMPVKRRWIKGKYNNRQSSICEAIARFGWDAFQKEVLCEKLTREGAGKLEKWFIACYDSADPAKGHNRALGGLGKGVHMSEASKKRASDVIIGKYENDPDYRERVRKGIQKAYKNDPDYRERVRKGVQKAYKNDPDYRERVRNGVRKAFETNPDRQNKLSSFQTKLL